jgi:hypothetical protein
MREAKRDVAPPGSFRRLLAKIERVMDFCCGVLFCYLGGAGLFVLVPAGLELDFEDAGALLTYLIGLAISAAFLLNGFWFFREWRRGRVGR